MGSPARHHDCHRSAAISPRQSDSGAGLRAARSPSVMSTPRRQARCGGLRRQPCSQDRQDTPAEPAIRICRARGIHPHPTHPPTEPPSTAALLPLAVVLVLCVVLPPIGALVAGQPLGQFLHLPLETRGWDALPPDPAVTWAGLTWAPRGRPHPLARPASRRRPCPTPAERPQGLADLGLGWSGPAHRGGRVSALWGGRLAAPLALLGLTLALNAHSLRRTGVCLADQNPRYFLALFPAGALLGWVIHWLNLYLQLWHYPDAPAPMPFALLATLDYAVLLPALLSLRQWLGTLPGLADWGRRALPLDLGDGQRAGWPLIALAGLGLVGNWVVGRTIYPLSWVAPLVLALGLQGLGEGVGLWAGLNRGDWGRLLLTGLAALLLGLAAQAWNQWAGPYWVLDLPLVGGPAPRGLPLIGWLGLIPLGLLGLWVADQVARPWRGKPRNSSGVPHQDRDQIDGTWRPEGTWAGPRSNGKATLRRTPCAHTDSLSPS